MTDKVFDLVDKWITYAKQNGIKAGNSSGKPPEDTDLAIFLKNNGFKPEQYQELLDKIPDAGDEKDSDKSKGSTELNDKQKQQLQSVRKLLGRLSNQQRTQLWRELT